MIDYRVRQNNEGQESVYKVCIPSKYKEWAIMAGKEDTTSLRVGAVQPDVSVGNHLRQFFISCVVV